MDSSVIGILIEFRVMNSIMFLPAMDRDLEVVLNDVKLNSLGFLETFWSQKSSKVKFDQYNFRFHLADDECRRDHRSDERAG